MRRVEEDEGCRGLYSHIGGVERARWEWSGGLVWYVPCVVIARMHVARMVSVCSGVTGRRLAADFGESDTRAAS